MIFVHLDANVRDPYESKMVETFNSEIDGAKEGLFAKQFLEMGTTVSFYNGTKAVPEEDDPNTSETNKNKIFDPIDLPDGTIDIPVWAQVHYLYSNYIVIIHTLYCSLQVPTVPP